MLQVSLFTKDPSNRLYVLVLNIITQMFLKIKISNNEEIIDRKHVDIKNAYFIFMVDCSIAYKEAKLSRSSKNNFKSFKDYRSIWVLAPEDVKAVYHQLFTNYRASRFVNVNVIYPTRIRVDSSINDSSGETNCQAGSTNMYIDMELPFNNGIPMLDTTENGNEEYSLAESSNVTSFSFETCYDYEMTELELLRRRRT